MKHFVILSGICLLLLVSLIAVPVLAATVTCPSSCSCLLPAEAKKIAAPGYCQGKQAVCGYDSQKNEKYCYEKPAPTTAVPQLIGPAKPYVTTTTIVPKVIATVKPFVTTTQPPAATIVTGLIRNTSLSPIVPATTGLPPGAGFHGIVTTKPEIPSVSPVNYSELSTSEVPCPTGCACLLSADATSNGLSYCGGKQTTCTVSSDFSVKGTSTTAEIRHCYTIQVAAGTSPNLSRVAGIDRTPIRPIPLPEECPGGCSCLDEKTIREKGYADCSSEKTECGYSKTAGVLYCAKTGAVPTGSGMSPSGAPPARDESILSALGSIFGTFLGGGRPEAADMTDNSRMLMDFCRDRYGLDRCGDTCVNLSADTDNCGSCGHWCLPGESCISSLCSDTDSDSDPANCGGVGNVCPEGAPCVEGYCSALGCLDSRLADCSNSCVDTRSDSLNCGACGNACTEGRHCEAESCVSCEIPGQVECPVYGKTYARCTDISSDLNNCGGCRHSCSSDQACVDGMCTTVCPAGTELCGNECRDLETDEYNCGACGHQCPYGATCTGGACTCADPGMAYCNGRCVNFSSDNENCGSCGHTCFRWFGIFFQHCSVGTCV